MRNTDINELFDADKGYEWVVKEVRKLLKVDEFDRSYFARMSLLIRCYDLLDALILKTAVERCVYVGGITERHYTENGKMPESRMLERLATWILTVDDEEDSGVLSERQMRTRNKEKEVPFHTPEYNDYAMELDGNRYVKPRPNMDSDESQRIWVKLPSDSLDKRVYNGPLDKFIV